MMNSSNSNQAPEEKAPEQKQPAPLPKPGMLQIVGSVLSAAIGIQSSKNQQRDFEHGRARNFIIAGIVFVVIFVATVFTVVSMVLKG